MATVRLVSTLEQFRVLWRGACPTLGSAPECPPHLLTIGLALAILATLLNGRFGPGFSAVPAIPVVDIFAGAGGLGEGFTSYRPRGGAEGPFRVALSAEMDANAVRTLRTRAFFHQFPQGEAPESYYAYLAGDAGAPWTDTTRDQWEAAQH